MAREGARHLYLLDYSKQVETFSETLRKDFPDTKVSLLAEMILLPWFHKPGTAKLTAR